MKRVLSTGDIANALSDENSGPFTQPKNVRKETKKAPSNVSTQCNTRNRSQSHSQSQILQASIAATTMAATATAISDTCESLQAQVSQLLATVLAQQECINSLKCKLGFVMSFLDIHDTSNDAIAASISNSPFTTSLRTVSDVIPVQTVVPPAASTSYADAVGVPGNARTNQTASQPTNFRQLVSTAVAEERRDRSRRAKSVIIMGLPSSSDVNDKTAVRQLCSTELGVELSITYVRRLGVDTQRARPLLVGLQSEQDAVHLLERAKVLRRSSDETIRRNIYINPNLSPDESRLAYEARCRRRERHQYGRRQSLPATNSSLSAGAAVFRPTDGVQPALSLSTTSMARQDDHQQMRQQSSHQQTAGTQSEDDQRQSSVESSRSLADRLPTSASALSSTSSPAAAAGRHH